MDFLFLPPYTYLIRNEEVRYMNLGNNLFNARKKSGLSQEEVAEKLGVSRQTISKWETDETLPDIRQAKKLALLYHLSLDELIDFDVNLKEIEQVIENTSEETQKKVDWTKVWGKKYPILTSYQNEVNIKDYADQLKEMTDRLKREYGYYYDLNDTIEVRFEEKDSHLLTGLLSEDIMDKDEKLFQSMWKEYFKSIAIKERLNLRLHRQHMPARFWKYMPEKR